MKCTAVKLLVWFCGIYYFHAGRTWSMSLVRLNHDTLLRKYDEDKYMYWIYNLLSHWVSNEVEAPTIVKLHVMLQKYEVIYYTEIQTPHIWNWNTQVLTWTLSWRNLTKPTYSFSSRNEEFKWITACQHIISQGKVVQTAKTCSRTTVSRQQVFGRSLPCS